ncbi:MAG: galactokinase [Lachnospiraceae bacterium]|nr:galactokinase [Lachnospiraceae bacterium]
MEAEKTVRESFARIFGGDGDIRCYFAPGRVNLIGEHTDYNGGHVFPCALTIGTYAAVRKRDDRKLRLYSENFPDDGVCESSLDGLVYRTEDGWANYPKGVINEAAKRGYEADVGFDIAFYGNIPNGSGLSSSASIEVLTGEVLRDMYGFDYDQITNALIGQAAENAFIGVNCGIMDQFAVAMGRKDKAIFLDTATLAYEYAPIVLDGVKIVIMNTNKKRGLGDSKYNERRAECEEALHRLQSIVNIATLGALREEEFERCKHVIGDEVLLRRARHAVTENARTIRAVEALAKGDINEFGQLMNASHRSLRDDYEVTGRELDTLTEAAWEQDGVIGARMTGAGFGGCCVSLVREECVEAMTRAVSEIYETKIGYPPSFYVVSVGDGPRRI